MGALTEAYNFLYAWLFGSNIPAVFQPYAESITMFIALFFVCAMMYFAFKLVTSIIRIIYNVIWG